MMRQLGPVPRQQGVILIIALIVLVAMTLAAIALVRSVDIATQISGNLAFRQSGVQAADSGVEMARKWLMTAAIASLNNDAAPSYYATANGGTSGTPPVFDPVTFNWNGTSALPTDTAGNTANYVIHRMCEQPLPPSDPNANCFTAPNATSDESHRITGGGDFKCQVGITCALSNNPYYRITVKVSGPKNTVTYVQAVVY